MQCNYSCTQADSLKKHVLTHAGKKPFRCTQCNYSCTQACDLKRHMVAHTGEKPFDCKQCNKTLTQPGNLKMHIQTHSGENLSGVSSVTILAFKLMLSRGTTSNKPLTNNSFLYSPLILAIEQTLKPRITILP